jgi:putative PIN family toxin of toxin-antitoxin system
LKVVFDTNVYIAFALGGAAATAAIDRTVRGRWRVIVPRHVLTELEAVLIEQVRAARSDVATVLNQVERLGPTVEAASSRHVVPDDPKDSPILVVALQTGADYLVSRDSHLLDLNPYESLRIISLVDFIRLLDAEGL